MIPADVALEDLVDTIFELASGFMAAKYLFVASELGVFDELQRRPAGGTELAERLAIEPSRVAVLLRGIGALGLVERRSDRYHNAPAVAACLTDEAALDLRPLLRFWDRMNYPLWTRLDSSIRSGKPLASVRLNGEAQRTYSEGVEACSALAARVLPDRYDFARHRRLLDLGGGAGTWTQAVLARHPHLNGTLFDLPSAARLARERLAPTFADTRLAILEGDFFVDAIPEGHDVVLIANVLHVFSPTQNQQLLASVRQRVEPGTTLLLVDYWTDSAKREPRLAALLAGSFLLTTGEGDVYSVAAVGSWLEAAGWELVESKPLPIAASLLVARARSH